MKPGDEPGDYFNAIESAFSRRRGAPLLLSPRDWALIGEWQRRGVPLRIALQGIDNCFDSFERRSPGARRINSLRYCRQEVLSLFELYLGLVGPGEEAPVGPTSTSASSSAARLLSRHLGRLARRAKQAMAIASSERQDALVGALAEALAQIRRMRKALATGSADLRPLEDDLARLDEALLDAARAALGSEEVARLEREADAALGAAAGRMSPEARALTRRAATARLLRRRCNLPRLTLFDEPIAG